MSYGRHIQCKLANKTDAHRYGSSIHNQRIENFWSHFKRIYLPWAIDFFKVLVATGSLILRKYCSNGTPVVCFFVSDSMRTRQINGRMERTENQES